MYKKAFWEDNNFQFVQEDNARAEDLPIAISSVYRADSYCVVPYAGYYYVQRSDSAMNRKTNEKLFGFPYRAFLQMYYSNRNFDSNNSEDDGDENNESNNDFIDDVEVQDIEADYLDKLFTAEKIA